MVAYASARRVAAALVALTLAISAGTPNAFAAKHDHTGVNRLWSQFPLGPQLRTPTVTQAPPTQPPAPPTSAPDRTSAHGTPAGGRDMPWWAWVVVVVVDGAALVAAIAWIRRRRRSRQAAAPPPGISDRPPPPTSTQAQPVEPAASVPPAKHPWSSGGPRTLDTLPRRELFAMANALGVENTVLMSREELIDVLSPRGPAAGSMSSEVPDRVLVRYAAAYAAACREGNPAPILAVTALVSPTTDDPAAHSTRMIAEARRRGLLTSPGRGNRGGELTERANALLEHSAPGSPPSSRR
jgi:hypothetical protein